jgi:2-methylisocitrate lyase-like PEP mutase family enzyme
VTSAKVLRGYLETPGKILIAPGAYDGISARLVAGLGFEVVYMTGGGTSASRIGQPDLGLVTMTEMVENAARIADCSGLPVIADADTGYGNALNVVRTTREYERAGVAAIHIEDQVFPKRCGYLQGKDVIPASAFIEKIKAAVDSRKNDDFVIIARTDARAVLGLEEAIERANLYVEAGADMAFVEGLESIEEVREIPLRVKAPCVVNMAGPATKTPPVAIEELRQIGYRISIYPGICMAAAIFSMREALRTLKEEGIGWDALHPIGPHEIFAAVGLEEWKTLEKKYSGAQ